MQYPQIKHILNSKDREKIHIESENKNLFHMSYLDKNQEDEKSINYFCHQCNKWVKEKDYQYNSCCGDEYSCGNFTIHHIDCCTDSYNYRGTIIWQNDPDDEMKCKETRKNNMIVISDKIEDLYFIDKTKNEKWWKKRINKRNKKYKK